MTSDLRLRDSGFGSVSGSRLCDALTQKHKDIESPADARVMRDSRHLGFYRTGNSTIQSAEPKTLA